MDEKEAIIKLEELKERLAASLPTDIYDQYAEVINFVISRLTTQSLNGFSTHI